MTNDSKPERAQPFTVFLVIASLTLAALSVVLAWQNFSLKRRLAQVQQAALAGGPEMLAAGDRVPSFGVVATSGEHARVEFDGAAERTLLLVFSSTCPACARTLPVWKRILEDGKSPALRVVGIQTDAGAAVGAAERHPIPDDLPFPIFGMDGERLEKVPYIPATIVLDRDGTVVQVWFGVLDADQQAALRAELGAAAASR